MSAGANRDDVSGACPRASTDYRVDRPAHQTYALLDADREAGAVLRADFTDHDFWMVTRYDHVLEALQQPDVFGNEIINPMDPHMSVHLLPNKLNPPEHTRLRRLLNRSFAPSTVRRLEPLLARRCAELVAEIRPHGGCDIVSDFAIRVPTEMFLATLGLPIEDGPQFVEWVEKVFDGFFGKDVEGAARAGEAIHAYFAAAADDRVARPRDPDDDFLSRLLVAEIEGEPLSREDLLTVCLTLMAAGLDTTRSMLGYIFHHLATHPVDRQRLVDEPAMTASAVEEMLRLYPLVIMSGRLVKRDIEFHGVPMKAGDVVWLGLGSANRDPRRFDRADEYVADRARAQHLAFAAGPHICLGLHLARHELTVAVREWHRQIPDYRLAAGPPITERGGGVLSLSELRLEWPAQP
jgi:cytochrome P450